MNRNRTIRSITPAGRDQPGPSLVLGVAFDVADPADMIDFFTALGLSARGNDQKEWGIAGEGRPCISIAPGQRKRLSGLSFGCPSSQIDALRNHAAQAGHSPRSIPGEDGFALSGPDGIKIALIASDHAPPSAAEGAPLLAHAPSRSAAPEARPRALSHVAIFVTDVDDALAFYADIVGLRLADRCGSELAFLHSPHGGGHHVLALVRSDGPGLHHYSFEMGTIDAIGLRAAHMAEAGYMRGWGMGRHVLGSNFFHYVRDPAGSHAELTTGLDLIAADANRAAGDHAARDAFYLWGPAPPAGFIDNPELQPVAA